MKRTPIKRPGSFLIEGVQRLQKRLRESKRKLEMLDTQPQPLHILKDVCGGAELWIGYNAAELTEDQTKQLILALGGKL